MSVNDWIDDEARLLHHKIAIANCMSISEISDYLRALIYRERERFKEALDRREADIIERCAKIAEEFVIHFKIDGVIVEPTLDTIGTPQIASQVAQAIRDSGKEGN